MKEYYKMLYNAFERETFRWNKTQLDFTELGYSNPFCGVKYYQEDNALRFMLIGRATNGWDVEVPLSNALDFSNEMDDRVKRLGFDWVYEDEGKLWAVDGTDPDKRYWLSRSAFWRTSKKIWAGLSSIDEVRWVENIVWSNLYKVAPKDFGNPTTGMCRAQQVMCKNLLREEIELYKPTHILLVTGWDWLSWRKEDSFLSIFKDARKTGEKHVVGVAYYDLDCDNRIPVVITRRPERCKEALYVEEALKWFKQLL